MPPKQNPHMGMVPMIPVYGFPPLIPVVERHNTDIQRLTYRLDNLTYRMEQLENLVYHLMEHVASPPHLEGDHHFYQDYGNDSSNDHVAANDHDNAEANNDDDAKGDGNGDACQTATATALAATATATATATGGDGTGGTADEDRNVVQSAAQWLDGSESHQWCWSQWGSESQPQTHYQ